VILFPLIHRLNFSNPSKEHIGLIEHFIVMLVLVNFSSVEITFVYMFAGTSIIGLKYSLR